MLLWEAFPVLDICAFGRSSVPRENIYSQTANRGALEEARKYKVLHEVQFFLQGFSRTSRTRKEICLFRLLRDVASPSIQNRECYTLEMLAPEERIEHCGG